jgi:hypothetical protein
MIQTSQTMEGNSPTGETPIAAPLIRTPNQRVRVFVSCPMSSLSLTHGRRSVPGYGSLSGCIPANYNPSYCEKQEEKAKAKE